MSDVKCHMTSARVVPWVSPSPHMGVAVVPRACRGTREQAIPCSLGCGEAWWWHGRLACPLFPHASGYPLSVHCLPTAYGWQADGHSPSCRWLLTDGVTRSPACRNVSATRWQDDGFWMAGRLLDSPASYRPSRRSVFRRTAGYQR